MVKRKPFHRNIINFISNYNDITVILAIKKFSFVRRSRKKVQAVKAIL